MTTKKIMPLWFEPVFFILILGISLALTFNFHKKTGFFNWKSEIWSDKAGYYIYLPATFYYHWDLKQCPPKMDEKTGYGFTYDYQNSKIRTKLTYGVAFMLSPFFVSVHYITKIGGIPQDWAFAPIYHKMVNVGAVVYLVLGLFLIFRFLKNYFSEPTAYIAVFLTFTGTNILYYSTVDTLMSHVYSFFLVALFLYSLKQYLSHPGKYIYFIVCSIALSFAVLISPTAIVILSVILLLDIRSRAGFMERMKFLFASWRLPVLLLIIFLVWLPQMIYDHYLTGHYIYYSNGQQGFSNLLSPRLPELWFSTLNGLFTYTPLMILIIVGMIMMILRKAANGWMNLLLFLFLSYLFSSWWCWYFGCSFGQRSFTDFLPLFSLPFAFLIEDSGFRIKKVRTWILITAVLLFSWFNISLCFAYNECFFGSVWDWNQYAKMLNKAKLWPVKPHFSFHNDFENSALCNNAKTSALVARSGDNSLIFDPSIEFNYSFFEYPVNMARDSVLTKLKVKFYAFKTSSSATGALIVCDISKDGQRLFYETRPLDVPMSATRKWFVVPVNFDFPANLDPWSELRVYIWNKAKTTFYIDDLEINSE